MALVRKRLGEILLEANMITEEQLRKALEEQKRTKESIGQILVRSGYVTENNIKDALELQFGINYVNPKHINIIPEVLHMLPENIIRHHQLIPITFSNNRLTIAMVDPTNLPAIDDVRLRIGKGISVHTVVITEEDFEKLLENYFSKKQEEEEVEEVDTDTESILGEINEDIEDVKEEELKDDPSEAETAPIIRLANAILINALKKKASDIHIEPQEKHIMLRYRIDGVLNKEPNLPKKIGPALSSRFKIMSNLDIAEKRLPQDGRLRKRYQGRDIDFRVSTLPSKYGEKIVMRILDNKGALMPLDKLFIYPEMLKTVREMINRPYGIIFVTGPTGSGKTTTLYSVLNERNTPDVNITTAEDPIEYDLPGITQVQAIPSIGLTFARILKAFLRQDPDIMLIGETRDKELAKIAIESALTGHLVFTSLHTNDAPGAITRLQEMGVDGFLISSATIGVIAQRLVRRLCPKCKEKYTPDEKILNYVGYRYKKGEKVEIYRAVGCSECNKGYKGRIGVYEIMVLNDELRDLINRNANKAMIRYAAKEAGMVPLKDFSLRLVADGYTDLDEVIRVTLTDEGAETLCPNCRNPIGDEFIKCPFCQVDLKKLCPSCNREIEEGWKSCPTCGINLLGTEKKLKSIKTQTNIKLDNNGSYNEISNMEKCPTCLANMEPDWMTCPYCHTVRTVTK